MPKFGKDEFHTEFLWTLVSCKENIEVHNSPKLDILLSALFPGIRLLHVHKIEILVDYCIPALIEQFPVLSIATSLEDAKKQYGEVVKVDKVKNCNGYEWVNWESVRNL